MQRWPPARMSASHKTPQYLLDECRTKYSWASGVTRGTPSVRHQHRKDLEIAFSEINGLMAGMHYQDEEESHRKTRQEYPTEIGEDDLFPEDDDQKSTANPKDAGMVDDQPMAPQWAAIHSLQKETEHLFNRFLVSASRSNDPILSGLLASYPNERTIRTTGAQLFKDVLDGFQPQELSHVFAFTCFSYSIAKVLYKNGCINKGDILAGLQDWRNLIVDKKEMEVFDRLAPELWPESKNHLHINNAPQKTMRDSAQAPSLSSHATVVPASVDLSASHLPFPQVSGQSSLTLNDHLAYSGIDMLDPGPPPNLQGDVTISDTVIQQMAISHGYFDFSAIDLLAPYHRPPDPVWPQPSAQNDPEPPGDRELFLSNSSKTCAPDREQARPSAKTPEYELVETGIFLVVLVFFQEISELLYALSGRTCLASRRHKLYGAQQKDQQAFYQLAKTTFFEPYYRGPASGTPSFVALLSVAEMFTQRGYIRTIAEVKHYLVTLAAAVLPPGAVFIQFISLVVSDNNPASLTPPPPTPTSNMTGKRKRGDDESPPPEQVSSTKVPMLERNVRCNWPDCNNSYKDLSGLGKHKVQAHIKPPPIPCGYGGCGYGNARRDRVRAHFLRQHQGFALPEHLRDTTRAGSVHPAAN